MAMIPVQPDGKVGEAAQVIKDTGTVALPQRQGGPHAHMVVFSPDNKYLLLADLGTRQDLSSSSSIPLPAN